MVLSPCGERVLATLSTSPLSERRTVLCQELVYAPCAITRYLAALSAVSYSLILSVGMPALYSPAPAPERSAHVKEKHLPASITGIALPAFVPRLPVLAVPVPQ
jgi:hypothetical protein